MTIEIDDREASTLGLLLQRLTYEDVRARAENEAQTYRMLDACERFRMALDQAVTQGLRR